MVLGAIFLLDFVDRVTNPKKPERKRIVDIGSFTGKPLPENRLGGKRLRPLTDISGITKPRNVKIKRDIFGGGLF